MVIRKSNFTDVEAIVELLKRSLGEQSSPKSIEYWIWKHVKNPFGESPVLVAEENGTLVGVRAMLQWHWQIGKKNMLALRAVDTATDPLHQGKGIFSRLTKQMIKDSLDSNNQFIFNTPNEKSKPGYIKMGWKEAGRITVGLSFLLPDYFNKRKIVKNSISDDKLSVLCSNWNEFMSLSSKIFTPKSVDYLNWRYAENPIINYQIIQTEDIYLALYVKKRKWGKEIRISELIFSHKKPEIKDELRCILRNQLKINKAFIISYSPLLAPFICSLFSIIGKFGPMLTIKSIKSNEKESYFMSNAKEWNYILGDMELF